MRVMGLSLTATSAVWVLLDTGSGTVLAEEVVAVTSVDEVARAAALSVQAFAAQTEYDIDSVHLTWTPDGAQHGIRLRTKLRLYGFDAIETITPEEAREGRNRTARHIAPHLAMAYGAARAVHAGDTGSVLDRLSALVPHRTGPSDAPRDGFGARLAAVAGSGRDAVADAVDTSRTALQSAAGRVPMRIAAAAGVIAIVGVALYAFVGTAPTPAPGPAPAGAVADPTPAPPHDAGPVTQAPEPVLAGPEVVDAQPEVGTAPEAVAVAEAVRAPVAEYVPEVVTTREAAAVPVAPTVEEVTAIETAPQGSPAAELATSPVEVPLGPAEQAPAGVGQPHLSHTVPVAGPMAVPEPAVPAVPAAPAPPPGPLRPFFDALP